MSRKRKDVPPLSEEERSLFLTALGFAQPAPTKKDAPREKVRTINEDFASLLESLPVIDKDAMPEKTPKKEGKISTKRPKFAFDALLDLHGMLLETAIKQLDAFLRRSQTKGFFRVLVIHGKGSGVLKNGVRAYLQEHQSVTQWHIAPPKLGGEGAVLVELRRK